jgi:large subunit ribosomal protein L9
MKVVLTQDVLKLGRAGDLKTVRDGYARNYLIPQGLAVLATAGAIRQAEDIRKRAARRRDELANEFSALAARIDQVTLTFHAKAGETGKLYGSITPAMIAERMSAQLGTEVDRRKLDSSPLRDLGTHRVKVYLASDIIGTCTVNILREGEVARPAARAVAVAAEGEPVEAELPEAELLEDELPEAELAEDELPEAELAEDELLDAELAEAELAEAEEAEAENDNAG